MSRNREGAVVGILLAASFALGFAFTPGVSSQTSAPPSRSFTLTETIHIAPVSASSAELRVWIPLPYEESSQGSSNAKITGLSHWKMYIEPEYLNRYVYATIPVTSLDHTTEIKASFHVQRFEHQAAIANVVDVPEVPLAELRRLTQSDRLVPIDGEIADIAQQQTGYATLALDKAQKVYDYMIAAMKCSGGSGELSAADTLSTLHAMKGDSADFASLFVALARSSGVPSRFEAGFILPTDAHSGTLVDEHAWAQIHVAGTGWVPVDPYDGANNKNERHFYFGGVDANRVEIFAGRDIHLYPPQKGAPLNYFMKAYAELDGQPYEAITTESSFKDDPHSGPSTTTTASAK
jgi:transglutaminase-like putative cysteine protease